MKNLIKGIQRNFKMSHLHSLPPSHLIILPVDQSKFEPELCRVDRQHSSLAVPVEAEHLVPSNHRDVYGHIQGSDDTMVTDN